MNALILNIYTRKLLKTIILFLFLGILSLSFQKTAFLQQTNDNLKTPSIKKHRYDLRDKLCT